MKLRGSLLHLYRVRLVSSLGALLLVSSCFEPVCETAQQPGVVSPSCLTPSPVDAGLDAGVDAGRRDAGVDAGADGGFDAGRDAGLDAGAIVDAGPLIWVTDGGLRVVDFGVVPITRGFSGTLSVSSLASDEGFLIESLSVDAGDIGLIVDQLDSPAGRRLIDGVEASQQLSRSSLGIINQSTLVLESDDWRAEFVPGVWRFRLASRTVSFTMPSTALLTSSQVRVRVYFKPKPIQATPQRLPLNLFFTGGAGLTSTSSTQPAHARFVRALETTTAVLADAGIVLDPIRRFDLPAGFSRVTSYLAASGNAGRSVVELGAQTARAPPGLNVVFVEVLTPLAGIPNGLVLGLAGGIPGITMSQGAVNSGVTVLYESAVENPDFLGTTIAHEICHQLGLSHVYQTDGELDNLSDTPDQGVAEAEDNLMAPTAQPKARLSPLQRTTLRRNPIVAP